MVERGANIDIVFRNGLKGYEVLPPPEVWNNIHPVINRKQRPYLLMKAAALVVVILSMSIFAYRWSRDVSDGLKSGIMAYNEEFAYPTSSPVLERPLAISRNETILNIESQNKLIEGTEVLSEQPVYKDNFSASINLVQKTDGLLMENSDLASGPQLAALNTFNREKADNEELKRFSLPLNDNIKVTDRWTIAALASPTYNASFNSSNDVLLNQLMASEQPIVSYSGGVAFSYKINKRLSIQSGLFYSSIGQEVEGINSYGGFQSYSNAKGDRNFEVLTSNGTVYTNNADVFLIAQGPGERILTNYTNDVFDPEKASLQPLNNNLLQNFSYLELPIILRYKFVDKIIDFNLIGGVSYNMLVNNSVYTMVDGSRYIVGETDGLNLFSVSSSIGMGMEYSFSENLSLNLEPTFRYYLNPFNQLSSSGTHPYSFGIFSGISFKF